MLKLSHDQIETLAAANFANLLEGRISQVEEVTISLPQEVQLALWNAARRLEVYNITSIRGCLIVTHILWDLGLTILEDEPAFNLIAVNKTFSEDEKANALWLLRTKLINTLKET
jgi:hypothetical protein